jgi:hypothetical protein
MNLSCPICLENLLLSAQTVYNKNVLSILEEFRLTTQFGEAPDIVNEGFFTRANPTESCVFACSHTCHTKCAQSWFTEKFSKKYGYTSIFSNALYQPVKFGDKRNNILVLK